MAIMLRTDWKYDEIVKHTDFNQVCQAVNDRATLIEVAKINERLVKLEYMVLQNDLMVPLVIDDAPTLIVDDDGVSLVADWIYKEV